MTLQQQAEELLTKLDLVHKLGQFGEAHVVGNVAFATTTKPDIDIQIYCNLHYEDAAKSIIEELTKIGLTDIRERRLKKSKKYLFLAKFADGDVVWDLDITLTQPSTDYIRDSYRFFQDYSPKMTDEKRNLIIKFKQDFTAEKIAGDNPAYYIYLGVLEKGITTDADMRKYLDEMRKHRR